MHQINQHINNKYTFLTLPFDVQKLIIVSCIRATRNKHKIRIVRRSHLISISCENGYSPDLLLNKLCGSTIEVDTEQSSTLDDSSASLILLNTLPEFTAKQVEELTETIEHHRRTIEVNNLIFG